MVFLKNSPTVFLAATKKAHKYKITQNTDQAEYKIFKWGFLKQNPEIHSYSSYFIKRYSLLLSFLSSFLRLV